MNFMFMMKDLYNNWFIKNLPTLLFIVLFLIYIIRGSIRGSRKGRILFIHMIIAGGLAAVFFAVITNLFTQGTIVTHVNNFIPGNSIQGLIGISEESKTIEEIILALAEKETIKFPLEELLPYINVVAEMVFRLAAFLLAIVLYWIIKFILYIFYFLFYSQRRYKKKITQNHENGLGLPYKKHALGGMIFGIVRGFVWCGILASFLGSIFYIASAGSDTTTDYIDNPDGNESVDYQNLYYMIRNYGNSGLFGALNKARNDEDIPYYLFFANGVVKGTLNTGDNEIDGDYYLTEELHSYVDIANRLAEIAFKYDLITELDAGRSIEDIIMDPAFGDDELYAELNDIIDTFKTPKLTKALLVGTMNTITADYEKYLSSISEDLVHNDLLMDVCAALFTGDDAIKISDIIKESDIRIMLKSCVSVLSTMSKHDMKAEKTQTEVMLYVKDLLNEIVPQFNQLSFIAEESAKEKFNKTMTKITNAAVKHVTIIMFDQTFSFEDMVVSSDLDWADELNQLFDISIDLVDMAASNEVDFQNMTTVYELFNKENVLYDDNKVVLDKLGNLLGDSNLLSTIFTQDFIYTIVEEVLGSSMQTEFSIPRDIEWANKKNVDGSRIKGEVSFLVDLMISLVDNNLIEILNAEKSEEEKLTDYANLLSTSDVVELIDKSKLVYYILSEYISKVEFQGIEFYLPESVLIEHTVKEIKYTLIKRNEISTILRGLKNIAPILELTGVEGSDIQISLLFENEELLELLNESMILSGTVVKMLVANLKEIDSADIQIPVHLDTDLDEKAMDNWIGKDKELSKIIKVFTDVPAIEQVLNNQEFDSSMFINLTDEEFDIVLESDFIYYNACNLIASSLNQIDIEILIPNHCYTDEEYTLLDKNELISLKKCIAKFYITDEETGEESFDLNMALAEPDILLESDILHASMINYVCVNLEEQVSIPSDYLVEAEASFLKENFTTNIWVVNEEMLAVAHAIHIMDIPLDNFEFNQEKLTTIINTLNDEKMDEILLSKVLWLTFSTTTMTMEEINVPSRVRHTEESDIYILKTEIKAMVNAMQTLEGVELNQINLDLVYDLTEAEINSMLTSEILWFTFSITLDTTEGILIPLCSYEDHDAEEKFILQEELHSLISAVQLFENLDIENVDINLVKQLANEEIDTNVSTLHGSSILMFTLTEKMLDNTTEDDVLRVPSSALTVLSSNERIIEQIELKSLILAIDSLGDKDIMTLDANYISTLNQEAAETLVSSDIIRYTMSDIILTVENINVPVIAKDYFDSEQNELGITRIELLALIQAIQVLDVDFNAITDDTILTLTNEPDDEILNEKLVRLTDSDIIAYTISIKILAIEAMVIPVKARFYYDAEASAPCEGSILRQEIISLVLGVRALNVTTFNAISANSITSLSANGVDIVLASDILHYTISNHLVDLDQNAMDIPTSVLVMEELELDEIIVAEEIKNIILGVKELNVTEFTEAAFTANSFLSLESVQIENICNSKILHYTISNKICESGDPFVIPEGVYATISIGFIEKAITVAEIVSLIDNLKHCGLEITNEAIFSTENLKLEIFADTYNTSAIIVASVSKIIHTNFAISANARVLDSGYINDYVNEPIFLMKKMEIHAILTEFKSLEIDINSTHFEINPIIAKIATGEIDIMTCSETTYIFIALLLEMLPISGKGDVQLYHKGVFIEDNQELATRASLYSYSTLINL